MKAYFMNPSIFEKTFLPIILKCFFEGSKKTFLILLEVFLSILVNKYK